MPKRAVVALGSNSGERGGHIAAGLDFLRSLHEGNPDSFLASQVVETEPVDCPPGSPPFFNAAASFVTSLGPHALLDRLLAFELSRGRPADHGRNTPRTLDMDLLLLDEEVLNDDRLTLPHPRMMERTFVLGPLADILPDLRPPGSTLTIAEALDLLRKLP